jgi:chaperonin GroEL (HSP60 family)
VSNSEVLQGMVFKRQVEGDVTKKFQAKVAVYTCAVDIMQTETKVRTCQFMLLGHTNVPFKASRILYW